MLTAGYAVVSIVGLLGIRVLTELAPPAVLGETNLWLGAVALWGNIFLTPFTSTQVKYHTEYRQSGVADAFTAHMLRWSLVAALAAGVIGAAAYVPWQWVTDRSVSLLPLAVSSAILATNAVRNVLFGRLNAERQQGHYAGWLAAEAALVTLVAAVSLWFVPSTISFLVGHWGGACLALVVFGVIFYPRTGRAKGVLSNIQRQTLIERVKRYGLPFVPLSLLSWLSHQADRYVLAAFASVVPVGLYAAVFTLASRPLLLVSGILNELLRPVLFDAENRGDRTKGHRVFVVWLVGSATLGGMVLACFWLFGEWIITYLLAVEYRSGAHTLLLWIGVAYTIYSVVMAVESRILSLGESRKLLLPQLVGAVGNLLFALVLIPSQGVLGAAQATTLSFLLRLLITLLVERQVTVRRLRA